MFQLVDLMVRLKVLTLAELKEDQRGLLSAAKTDNSSDSLMVAPVHMTVAPKGKRMEHLKGLLLAGSMGNWSLVQT